MACMAHTPKPAGMTRSDGERGLETQFRQLFQQIIRIFVGQQCKIIFGITPILLKKKQTPMVSSLFRRCKLQDLLPHVYV